MVSNALIERTKRHEGLILKPMHDLKGAFVIGYGHDITPEEAERLKDGITEAQAIDQLLKDLSDAEYSCKNTFQWLDTLSEIRQEVLVEMAFQMGMGGLLTFHKMLMCASGGDYTGAALQMVNSAWYNQTPHRCYELAEIMRTGRELYEQTA